MDVKEVVNHPEVKKAKEQSARGASSDTRAPLATLVASSVISTPVTDQVKVSKESNNPDQAEVRKRLNEVISHVNVAEESTTRISELVQSIGGIAEQAENVTPERRKVLEREGNTLVEEIKRTALKESSRGVKPLAGDEIRVEIEERLGRVLDAVLPDDAKDAFGINSIDFSTKESIISTVTQIKQAEEQLQKLREAVDSVSKNVREVVSEVDVALQNNEAANVSVRDVDEALKLAHSTQRGIGDNPERAISSVGDLRESALKLLK